VDSGTTANLNRATYANGKYVICGQNGTLLVSEDTRSWSPAVSRTTNELHGITFGDGNFVVVGAMGSILSSMDALSWSPRPTGTRNDLFAVVYARDTFVVVGDSGTVLQSGVKPFSLQFDYIQAHPTGLETHLVAEPGRSFRIQTSTNLVDWIEVGVETQPKNGVLFLDGTPPTIPAKFYRAVAP
jgi:hypothetical protein